MSWPLKPLGEILELSGRNRAGDQDLPVLSITMKHGLVDQADKFKKRVASSDTSNYRVAYKNELVVGFPIDEGVLGFQTKYPAGIVSPAYDIWKLRSEADSHIPYLERYLRSAQARGSYASRMQGAVARRRSLTKTDFLDLEIPFPPLDDQIRIAHLLGKVEGLIAQRKQHLQQLDDLLKSVFLAMIGDPARNEKGWEKKEIGAFTKVGTGSTPSRQKMAEYYGGSIPWVKTTEVQNGDIVRTEEHITEQALRETSCSVYPAGTILLAMYGQGRTRGQVGYLRMDAATNQACAAILPSIHNQTFIFQQLSFLYDSIRALGRGGNQENLNLSLVRGIELVLPPNDIQGAFVTIVEKVEALKTHYQQSLANLEILYGSLSQQAFKGELDLSRVALPAAPIEGEMPVADAVRAPITTPVIELPETDLLLPALQDRTQLAPLLRFWLEAYTEQLGDMAFSVDQFMREVEARAEEAFPDSEFELGADAFELIKAWVFDALRSRRLVQVYPNKEDDIRVAVRKPQTVAED